MKQIGFIGCGNMGGAMLRGILKKGLVQPGNIIVSDANSAQLAALASETGVCTTPSNAEAAKAAVLVLAVKPQYYVQVIEEIKGQLSKDTVVVTVAPGFTLKRLEELLGAGTKLVRTMPNTPAMVGAGVTAACKNGHVTAAEFDHVQTLLNSMGTVEIIPEHLMDAVVGVSGSAPAYVFMFLDALADAGVRAGLPRAQALRFAAQATLGSARLLLESGKHPAELKDMVCSPGGTTIEAVAALEEKGFRAAILAAAQATIEKSKKMGQ